MKIDPGPHRIASAWSGEIDSAVVAVETVALGDPERA
jgi:hypothetical protein